MKSRPSFVPTALSAAVFICGLALGVSAFPGCGSKTTTSSTDDAKSKQVAGNSEKAPVAAATPRGRARNTIWTDRDGRKYFGKIPLEVFHSRPYEVAKDQTKIGIAGTNNGGGAKQPKMAKTEKPKAAASFASIASGTILDAEAKRIRNSFTQKLQTVGRFNRGFREVQAEAATLAAVAQAVAVHSDDVSWKADALYVRDLATAMNSSADAIGKKKFDETKASFEKFGDIMNRSKPAGLKKPEEGVTLDTSADRGGLMRRMDAAHAWLKKDVPDEETFKAEIEKIKHEATILALLTKVITDPSYYQADEKEYREFAQNIVDASKEMVAAATTGNFKNYRAAVEKVINNCNNCHTGYKD